MAYSNILQTNNAMAINHDCEEGDTTTNEKHYMDLSSVNLTNSFINTPQDNNHFTAITSSAKEIVPSFQPDDFLFESCYTKKYYTEDSRLEDLKTDEVMSGKDDSMGIEEDFDSSYTQNDSNSESRRNDSNFNPSYAAFNSEMTSINNNVKSARNYSSGIGTDLSSTYSKYNSKTNNDVETIRSDSSRLENIFDTSMITTNNDAQSIKHDFAGIESLYNTSYAEYNSKISMNSDGKMGKNVSSENDANVNDSEMLAKIGSVVRKMDCSISRIECDSKTTQTEQMTDSNNEDKKSVTNTDKDSSQNSSQVMTAEDDKEDNKTVDGTPIKTEAQDDQLENMITILVPQDMDMKSVKLEPEDTGYEKITFLDDDEIHEIDDSEDFYIIQVQDPININLPKEIKRPRRSHVNKPQTNPNQQLSKCEQCEYQTYDKSNLRKHKLIHTDLKPYSCNLCSFTCKLPKYLKQHMITHMTVRLFPCPICCHRCRNLTELNRHIKRHLKLNKKSTVDELTDQEKTYCVCRDGCKTSGGFNRKIKREKRDHQILP